MTTAQEWKDLLFPHMCKFVGELGAGWEIQTSAFVDEERIVIQVSRDVNCLFISKEELENVEADDLAKRIRSFLLEAVDKAYGKNAKGSAG